MLASLPLLASNPYDANAKEFGTRETPLGEAYLETNSVRGNEPGVSFESFVMELEDSGDI